MLAFGNAGVAYAEQWIATGNAAMMIATVPLWIVVFDWHRGNRPHRLELWGIALGVARGEPGQVPLGVDPACVLVQRQRALHGPQETVLEDALVEARGMLPQHPHVEAVVAGELTNPLPDNGWNSIDLPLILDWLARPRSIVSHELGKPSLTHWRLSDAPPPGPGMTRLDLHPVTGRSHQLRVHLQAIGHPIVGDPLYASPEQEALADRLLLHARRLDIEHPVTGAMMRFEAPCPF